MRTDYMTKENAATAAMWLSEHIKMPFPSGWMPETGMAVYGDEDQLLCVGVVYFEKSSPVAIFGWCAANPQNTFRQSYDAVRILFAAIPIYARNHGAKHLISMFGCRSLNRLLDNMGFINGDNAPEQKYIRL